MHQAATGHIATEMLPYGLMAKAYAKKWLACFGTGRDKVKANASFVGGLRSGRNKECLRARCNRLSSGNIVIAHNFNLRAQFHQIMDKVPSKAVVIVYD
jgi:hypothetical protein